MKLLVLGGTGLLGHAVIETFTAQLGEHAVHYPSRAQLDLRETVDSSVTDGFDIVINCTAFHGIDPCERDPASAQAINTTAPGALARAATQSGARFLHISSDYVFDGLLGRPYHEIDTPTPLSTYGKSKVAGEQAVLEQGHWVVRTTALFDRWPSRSRPNGSHFVDAVVDMARRGETIRAVNEQSLCPTLATDTADQLWKMVHGEIEPGLYHAVNGPGQSWADFAQLVLDIAGLTADIEALDMSFFGEGAALRPRDSRLVDTKFEAAGITPMPDIRQAVARHLAAKPLPQSVLRVLK